MGCDILTILLKESDWIVLLTNSCHRVYLFKQCSRVIKSIFDLIAPVKKF